MAIIPPYQEMRQKADPLWQAIFAHPFVKGIGGGSLSRDRFEFYLKQDYLYLIDFSRVFALACAKSRDLGDMGTFATLLSSTLTMEMELHRFYRDWVETYSSREFRDLGDGLIDKMNAHAGDAPGDRMECLFELYEASTRFEYLFFDMSWKKEEWPGCPIE